MWSPRNCTAHSRQQLQSCNSSSTPSCHVWSRAHWCRVTAIAQPAHAIPAHVVPAGLLQLQQLQQQHHEQHLLLPQQGQQQQLVLQQQPVAGQQLQHADAYLDMSKPEDIGFPDHKIYLKVRPNEVDMYGVVTNTVYAEYMYTARAACAAAIGCPLESMFLQDRVATATTHININIKGALKFGDAMYAESVPFEVKGATVKFKERVVRLPSKPGEKERVVAEGEAWCCALQADILKPTRWPAYVKERLLKRIAAAAADS